MVAVLALSHTRGGHVQRWIAWPIARVDSTRDSKIRRRFRAWYRQLTDCPARLITASAVSSSSDHGPTVLPSHATPRAGGSTSAGRRERTTTSQPRSENQR